MKKITFFIGSLEEGGAERVISYLTSHFADNGLAVSLVLFHDRELFYPLDERVEVRVVEKEVQHGGLLSRIRWLRRYFRRESSIVLSFLAPFNIVALLAGMGVKTPILVADRNDPRFVPGNPFLRLLRNGLYRFADGVILQTRHNRAYFSKRIQKKSRIIYNPIDLGDRRGEALRTPKEELVVSVSRLMPQKNQTMLIRAFAAVHAEFPAYRLVIYGEGSARRELEDLICSLEAQDYILLPGSEKQVFDKICPATLFVLSSHYEGMPNALAEAMCLGLPCISTAVSGATDMIQSGENGWLISPGNTEELTAAMRCLLSDPSKAAQLGQQAVKLNDTLAKSVIAEEWRTYVLSFVTPS